MPRPLSKLVAMCFCMTLLWSVPVIAQRRGGNAGAAQAQAAQKQMLKQAQAQQKQMLAQQKQMQKQAQAQKKQMVAAAKQANAAQKAAKKKPDTAKKEAKKAAVKHQVAKVPQKKAQDHASISLLHEARTQIASADHDYAGHRVLAMQHVHAALRHLGSPASGGMGGGQGKMPQAMSDAALRMALTKLEAAQGQLQHNDARGAVASAIQELSMALTIR